MHTYKINFQGYWRDINKGNIPAKPGVYLVYRGKYDSSTDTIGLIEIIYIGQGENVQQRIANNEKEELLKQQLRDGEELVYAFAPVKPEELDIIEQSLIFAQKPIVNEAHKEKFEQEEAAFKIDGQCIGLKYTDYTITK